MFFDFIGVFKTAILRTFVRVVDEQVVEPGDIPVLYGHLKCLQIGLGKHPVRGVPTQDFSGIDVFDQDNVKPGKSSLIECMRKANTPSKMLYEQADVENMSSSTNCIPFGKGTEELSSKCILTSSGR